MAAGKPVVANAHGGVTEMLEHERSGALVPVNDEAAMARTILRLVDAPDLRRAWGAAGQARARERFDVGLYAREIRSLFAGFLSPHGDLQDPQKGR
jgi:glycosyltransferase involved in cell wall biosynthesis